MYRALVVVPMGVSVIIIGLRAVITTTVRREANSLFSDRWNVEDPRHTLLEAAIRL